MRRPFPRPDIENTTLLAASVVFWSVAPNRDAALVVLGFGMAYGITLFLDFVSDLHQYAMGKIHEGDQQP